MARNPHTVIGYVVAALALLFTLFNATPWASRASVEALKADTQREIGEFRQEVREDIKEIKQDIKEALRRLPRNGP